MTKVRFFVSVLALAALALPAGATVVDYCAGTGCSPNDQTAFNTAVSSGAYTYEGLEAFTSSNLSADMYSDPTSGVVFSEFFNNTLSVTGGNALKDQYGASTNTAIVITLPVTVLAVEFTANNLNGASLCMDSICPTNESSGFFGAVNSSPTGTWTVTLQAIGSDQPIEISNFDVATAGAAQGPGSETPEVGTLLLIGSGLVSMRWMRRAQRRLFPSPQPAC